MNGKLRKFKFIRRRKYEFITGLRKKNNDNYKFLFLGRRR